VPITPKIVYNEWSAVSIVVKSEPLQYDKVVTVFIDGQIHSAHTIELRMLAPDVPLRIFHCQKNGAAQESCDVRFVRVDLEALPIDRVLELHVPMGVWRCGCKQFNGSAHYECQMCYAEKQKSGNLYVQIGYIPYARLYCGMPYRFDVLLYSVTVTYCHRHGHDSKFYATWIF
jgi:hypothetical protein